MKPNAAPAVRTALDSSAENRRKLLQQRLSLAKPAEERPQANIAVRPADAIPEASNAQKRIWVLHEIQPDSPTYRINSAHKLTGRVDLAALDSALNSIIARHETLRSTFQLQDGVVVQRTQDRHAVSVSRVLCCSQEDLNEQSVEFARLPMDLRKGPLLRLALFSLGENYHLLVLTAHDIVFDGWSSMIFWREFSEFYNETLSGNPAALPKLWTQYSDFSYWQRNWLSSSEATRQTRYWRETLKDPPPPIPLPTDFPYPTSLNDRGKLEFSSIPATTTLQLRDFSNRNEVSINVSLMLGFYLLLARYAQTEDILISTPVANRRSPEAARLIGLFVNTLAIRIDLSDDPTCLEALARARAAVLDALGNQDLPVDKVLDTVQPLRVPGRHPLFQTMFVYQSESEAESPLRLCDCKAESVVLDARCSKFDLSLFISDSNDSLRSIVEYRQDIFRSDTIKRFLEHYSILLQSLANNPQQRISELDFLTPHETRFHSLHESGPLLKPTEDRSVLDLINLHNTSPRNAIIATSGSIDYIELDRQSDAVMAGLRRVLDSSDKPIPLLIERSPLAVVALLGIMKAGFPYLPIDMEYPDTRIRWLLDDSSADLVLASRSSSERFQFEGVRQLIVEELLEARSSTDHRSASPIEYSTPVYLVYTSGSSGTPKGVQVAHANLLASTASRIDYYGTDQRTFLLAPSLSFDSSVAGIFWTLCTGGTLVIPNSEEARDPDALCQLIEANGVDTLLSVPTLYQQLVSWKPRALDSLKIAIVAGESCSPHLARLHQRILPHCDLFNEYGPTEATVWASVYKCEGLPPGEAVVPIGKPIAGTTIRILDRQRRNVPVGFTGELCIAGSGVVSGYYRRNPTSDVRFFHAKDGMRFYATGDLASWTQDGLLVYHGRNDEQIKIRGHRIETGEIESCLRSIPQVTGAAVVAQTVANISRANEMSLEELIAALSEETVSRAFAQLDAGKDSVLAPDASAHSLVRKIVRPEFEVNFSFATSDFIAPPRQAQKNWMIGQAINEISDDLVHLDRIARDFVPGKNHQLQSDLIDISNAKLSDDQIMEDWQAPLMKTMAQYVTESKGDVLEIGFGRGVSASFIQQGSPRSHTIIEVNRHSAVTLFEQWKRTQTGQDIRMIHSRWQDAIPDLGQFDSILFHTYPMNEDEFVEYILNSITFAEHAFESMARHLKTGGVFTYLTAEIDSLSRRHQRALFQHFSKITFEVIPVCVPPDTIDSWWAKSMVAIKAIR